jgi:hypothetical protein
LLGDQRFSRWLIPGVAEPPVYTFIGLLTAFVVLVGPVAYRRTTRYGRGYLMFAIAPLLALMTTLAMFGYGIVADGFDTTARIRQLTWVDGRSGDAGERIRATYFAGVAPREGIRFDGAAEVIGYPESTGKSWSELNEVAGGVSGRVVVTDRWQRFDRTFLPSRQQRQFVTHLPRLGLGAVSLKPSAEDQGRDLHSSLDFDLARVVARDADGRYWTSDALPGGVTRPARLLPPPEAAKALATIYGLQRPISAVREARRGSRYGNQIRDLIASINRSLGSGGEAITDGLFEAWLVGQLQIKGELPPQWFVATAAVDPQIVAVEGAELVESIRYVYGTMP